MSIAELVGIIVTIIGFGLVIYQIRRAQKDAMMSSLIAAVANHWMLIEERRLKIRSGDLKIYHPRLLATLEEELKTQYQGNLAALADDFLWEPPTAGRRIGKKAVFNAIAQEHAIMDASFNLYEEEFMAAQFLKLTSSKLWKYWDWYLRGNFGEKVTRNHWRLRAEHARVFPQFVEFVMKKYLSSPSTEERRMPL